MKTFLFVIWILSHLVTLCAAAGLLLSVAAAICSSSPTRDEEERLIYRS